MSEMPTDGLWSTYVEGLQLATICVECRVIEIRKLLSDRVDVGHVERRISYVMV